jgi:hypothetical protein
MEGHFAAQALTIAAGRKHTQSEAPENNKTEEGKKKKQR